jgi:hypothetical protein
MPPNDQEPRYRLVDSSGTVVGSLFVNGDGDVAIQDENANEVSLGAPGLDLSGNALTDTTQGYLDLTGNGNDVRVATGSSIDDGNGTNRFKIENGSSRLYNQNENLAFFAMDGNRHTIRANATTPVGVWDGVGGFFAVRYTASSSRPGTLELANALLNYTVNVSDTDDSMTANPETDTESGYITVEVNGTQKQIPVYDP